MSLGMMIFLAYWKDSAAFTPVSLQDHGWTQRNNTVNNNGKDDKTDNNNKIW